MSDHKVKLFLVDDDAVYLKLLEMDFLQHADFSIQKFGTGESCLAYLENHQPDFVILDYHLDGIEVHAMNGIATLDAIKLLFPDLPVIMLSAQDKIEVAIECMHHKAYDYVVKSETSFIRLQQIITRFFGYKKMEKELNWYMDKM